MHETLTTQRRERERQRAERATGGNWINLGRISRGSHSGNFLGERERGQRDILERQVAGDVSTLMKGGLGFEIIFL